MSKRVEQLITRLVEPAVTDLGYELVDVGFEKEGPNFVLTVYIDKPGGVSLDDCEKVSIEIDPIIDEADPIEQSYYLSVSSIGLDRPIKTPKDFARSMGKEIVIKLFAPVNKKKEFVGTLVFADEKTVAIEIKGSRQEFNHKDIALVKPYININ